MTKRQIQFILASLLLICSAGCSTLDYIGPSGESIHYSRIGPQKLDDVQITLPDGVKLGFDKQEADVSALIDSFTAMLNALKP